MSMTGSSAAVHVMVKLIYRRIGYNAVYLKESVFLRLHSNIIASAGVCDFLAAHE